MIKGNYTEEEILNNIISKSKINTNKTQNLLKNIEDRIIKEKQTKQNATEEDSNKIHDKDNQMVIDDERENDMYKITSPVFDINIITPEQNIINNINLCNQLSKESNIENSDNVNNNSPNKDKKKEKENFGHKRTFQQFFSQVNWENAIADGSKKINDMINLANKNFNQYVNLAGNSNNNYLLNKNITGLSVYENPFIPKRQTTSIETSLFNSKEPELNQIYSSLTEIPNQAENFNNINENISRHKKTIPFQNNFNGSLSSINENIPQSNTNIIYPSNVHDALSNIQPNRNPNIHSAFTNCSNNQSSFALNTQCLPHNMSFPNFGSYNNNFLGIEPNFNGEKDAFSKAIINNKIYTEDKNDFIQVVQQQSKKPNYREGLFDKEDNSSSNILKNNFGKPSLLSFSSTHN